MVEIWLKASILNLRDDFIKESRTLELKESITESFLKTVNTFSNYDGGEIILEIDDDGNIKGLSDPKNTCLDTENRINDNIVPLLGYSLKIDETNKIIPLVIKEGKNKPYLYNPEARKRNDTSTIEVDSLELTRLVSEGKKINFEDLPSSSQKMDFHYLEDKLEEHINIKIFNQDTLKTLNPYNV